MFGFKTIRLFVNMKKVFFFKQKTAYEIGLGIPAEPLFRSLVGLGGKSAADKGKDTRDYLAAAFPELNAWERAGADASSARMVDAGFENQKELTKMQLDNQKEIAEMQNETQKEIAGRSEERRVGKECRAR